MDKTVVVVPEWPTREMQDAWDRAPYSEDIDEEFRNAYRAMISAAPAATAQQDEREAKSNAAILALGNDLARIQEALGLDPHMIDADKVIERIAALTAQDAQERDASGWAILYRNGLGELLIRATIDKAEAERLAQSPEHWDVRPIIGAPFALTATQPADNKQPAQSAKFQIGDRVKKVSGSQWHGKIVGTYSTALTPEGYAVESATEEGSVQIYPAKALERWDGGQAQLSDEEIERAAQELWNRFAPLSSIEWINEPHKSEYREAARAILSRPSGGKTGEVV